MKRYFMTIPEAVQLVLQSATLGQGGEVFMLDMGEPVKIVDLARDLIELSGLQVGLDIDIDYSGLRPGEKLFEEMFLEGESYERTQHEKIFIAANASSFVPYWLDKAVRDLEQASEMESIIDMLVGLKVLVPEFQPQGYNLSDSDFGQHTGPLRPIESSTTRKGIRLSLTPGPP
jgi:FlaA1/EpsC-like NDP-sugar epimerase